MKKGKARKDLYQEVTDKLVKMMEEGVNPWAKPWTDSKGAVPMNYKTKKPYRGINFFLLSLSFNDPYFLTYKQAQELGGNVRKGERGTKVYFWNFIYLDANGKKVLNPEVDGYEKKIPYLREYTVFNATQIEGIEFVYPEAPELKDNAKIEACEAVVKNLSKVEGRTATERKIVVHLYDGAWYSPSRDIINMPKIESFKSSEFYYDTLFHEMIHFTGLEGRCNRFKKTDSVEFGSESYSEEELVAEMGGAYLCALTGISSEEISKNNAAYLAGWIKKLKGNPTLAIKAAGAAQKAVDYITAGM